MVPTRTAIVPTQTRMPLAMFISSIITVSNAGIESVLCFLDGVQISVREYLAIEGAAIERHFSDAEEEGC